MSRRVFAFLSALSLLVFLGVVALLVLSIIRPQQVVRGTGPDSLILHSSGGELSIARGHYDPDLNATYIDRPGDTWRVQYVYPAAVAAVLPLSWLVARLRRRPHKRPCPNCGFELRATEKPCPKCGAAVTEHGSKGRPPGP